MTAHTWTMIAVSLGVVVLGMIVGLSFAVLGLAQDIHDVY